MACINHKGRKARRAGFLCGECVWLLFIMLLAGCGGPNASSPPTSIAKATPHPGIESAAPVSGLSTFVIVPAESKASYHATEEFFPAALERLGIKAGKAEAVGTTQAIEGRFQLDPERPGAPPGDNSFSVRLNTLKSNQQKRDDYLRQIRGDGPSCDKYRMATFRATAIDGSSATNASGREFTLKLTGDLTVREITKRELFDVKARLTGNTLAGAATTRFLLSDFGIGPIDFPPLLAVADPVALEVQFTARAQP